MSVFRNRTLLATWTRHKLQHFTRSPPPSDSIQGQACRGASGGCLVYVLMGLFSNFCACLETKLRIRGHNAAEGALDEVFETNDLFFELRTLELATNFFSELNQLGHGGFGPVYKVCHL